MQDKVISERIDRNGTKHQIVETSCDRCGGAGESKKWQYTGLVCFKCNGSGRMTIEHKIYTPEHAAKLEQRRIKRQEKKDQERREQAGRLNADYLKKWGFDQEVIYIVTGNTYSIKDELKEQGARFDSVIGYWYFSEQPKVDADHPLIAIPVKNLIMENLFGEFHIKSYIDCQEVIDKKIQSTKKKLPESNFIGHEGDKISLTLTVAGSFPFDVPSFSGYGTITLYLNRFQDSKGNILVWKTGRGFSDGEKILLTGRVKEHQVYKEEKQTVLTRCRVKQEDE